MARLFRAFGELVTNWTRLRDTIAKQDAVIRLLSTRATVADIRASGRELNITIYRGDEYMQLTLYNANCDVKAVRKFIGLDA